jgi:hypothetical protein
MVYMYRTVQKRTYERLRQWLPPNAVRIVDTAIAENIYPPDVWKDICRQYDRPRNTPVFEELLDILMDCVDNEPEADWELDDGDDEYSQPEKGPNPVLPIFSDKDGSVERVGEEVVNSILKLIT